MATDYNALKVTELKEILKERGIPQTGLSRKQQIVEALEKHDADFSAEDGAPAESDAPAEAAAAETEVEEVGDEVEEAEGADAEAQTTTQEVEMANTADAPPSEEIPPAADDSDSRPTQALPQDQDLSTSTAESTQAAKEAAVERIVLETNHPVSKEPSQLSTPQRLSPGADSRSSSDTRKRKRRSPTPPLSQESVKKKLKAAEDDPLVTLPEDRMDEDEEKVVQQAPVAVERTAESGMEDEKVLPSASSDDVMHLDDGKAQESKSEETVDSLPPPGESAMEQAIAASEPVEDTAETEADSESTSPAIHPATRALYVRDLVRPLQAHQLRTHLVDLATPPNGASDESILETFHIDTIRTHAFAIFASVSAAARARSALHARIWPDEPTRKPLWVDFVPEEKVEQWIETEQQAEEGRSRAGVRRWEVIYHEGEEGVEARLEEASSMPSAPLRQQSSSSATGQAPGMGMPNAPLGPRGAHQPANTPRPPPSPDKAMKATPTPAPPPSSASFGVLDERFRHTTTKPKLYYLPAQPSLVADRLESLAGITSRDWDPEREGSFTGSGEVRRYTFEDGERVVDGGPDIGNFGRPRGMELDPRMRRGGYRGGRR